MDDVSLSTNEWNKLNSQFTTAGYREGITAGKESALQEGFDAAFANVGAPIGRELGLLRGMAIALISFLSSSSEMSASFLDEARQISAQLSDVRFNDIAPKDLEAEQHAKEHLAMEGDDDDPLQDNDELATKRNMEKLQDDLAKMTAASTIADPKDPSRPCMEDVTRIKARLDTLVLQVGITVG